MQQGVDEDVDIDFERVRDLIAAATAAAKRVAGIVKAVFRVDGHDLAIQG